MEIDKWYPERGTNIFEKDFLNFYFLKVDISLTMQDPNFKLYIFIKNIAVEGTVSQIFDTGPSSFYKKKLEKNIQQKKKKLPVFWHKIKTKIYNKILRHSSLETYLRYMHPKCQTSKYKISWHIDDQK